MQELIAHGAVRGYGYGSLIAWARWVPSAAATQVINGIAGAGIDSFGIKSIVLNSTGNFTATLQDKPPGFVAFGQPVFSDVATVFHDMPILALDVSAGTINFLHVTQTYANIPTVAMAPANATSGFLQLFVFARQPL